MKYGAASAAFFLLNSSTLMSLNIITIQAAVRMGSRFVSIKFLHALQGPRVIQILRNETMKKTVEQPYIFYFEV